MKAENFLKEYVRRLSDEDLRNLSNRFVQNLCGDKAEISEILSKNSEVDKWLRSASGSSEFFDMLDEVEKLVLVEDKHRSEQAEKKEEKPKRKSNKTASVDAGDGTLGKMRSKSN